MNPKYYDYEKKKYSYITTQTAQILLKDFSKYDTLTEGLVNEGINRIDNVEFKSSKMTQLLSKARKLDIKDAKAGGRFCLCFRTKVRMAVLNRIIHKVQSTATKASMAMDELLPEKH